MKVKAGLAALFLAGMVLSLALGASASTRHDGTGTTATGTTSTSTTEKPKCHAVELSGTASAGSVSFKALHKSKNSTVVLGSTVSVAIPEGARVMAVACTGTGGTLTFRSVRIVVKPPHPEHPEHKGGDDKKGEGKQH